MEKLFHLVPQLRRLGHLHYAMTQDPNIGITSTSAWCDLCCHWIVLMSTALSGFTFCPICGWLSLCRWKFWKVYLVECFCWRRYNNAFVFIWASVQSRNCRRCSVVSVLSVHAFGLGIPQRVVRSKHLSYATKRTYMAFCFLQTSTFDDPWQAIDIVQMLLRCLVHCIPLRLCWSCISGISSCTPWLMFRALESLHSSSDENSGICVSKKCWRLIFFIVWTFSVFLFRCFDQKLNILPMHQSLILEHLSTFIGRIHY